jgi:hypothetical protein
MHLHVCLWVDLCLTCRGVDVDGDLIGGSVLIYSLLERSPPYLFVLKGSFSMAAPVSPITFSQRMEQHWVETLGNASSENLREIWKQLGAAFGQAIVSHGKPEGEHLAGLTATYGYREDTRTMSLWGHVGGAE